MYKSLQEIVDQLEFCDFWTHGYSHPLKMNTAFIALKERAREEKELSDEKEYKDSVREIVVRIDKKCDEIRAALPRTSEHMVRG